MSNSQFNKTGIDWDITAYKVYSNPNTNLTLDASGNASLYINTNNVNRAIIGKNITGNTILASCVANFGTVDTSNNISNMNTYGTYYSNGVSALKIPADTTVSRPPGQTGYIRYNTTTNLIEYWNGQANAWISQATPSVIGSVYGRWDASAVNLGYGFNTLTTSPSNLTNNNNVAVGTNSLNSLPTISEHNRLQGILFNSSQGQQFVIEGFFGSSGSTLSRGFDFAVGTVPPTTIANGIFNVTILGFDGTYTYFSWGGASLQNGGGGYASLPPSVTVDIQSYLGVVVSGQPLSTIYFAFPESALVLDTYVSSTNTALGFDTLRLTQYGYSNTAIGYQAGENMVSGYNNTFIGTSAGATISGSAFNNVIVGSCAGNASYVGSSNVVIGQITQSSATSASDNTLIGNTNGTLITSGSSNTLIGAFNGQVIDTGGSNTLIGRNNANSLTTGSTNTIIGTNSGTNLTTGSNNLFLGSSAGVSTVLATGSNNTCIGRLSDVPSAYTGTAISNSMWLGSINESIFITGLTCNVPRFLTTTQQLTLGSMGSLNIINNGATAIQITLPVPETTSKVLGATIQFRRGVGSTGNISLIVLGGITRIAPIGATALVASLVYTSTYNQSTSPFSWTMFCDGVNWYAG